MIFGLLIVLGSIPFVIIRKILGMILPKWLAGFGELILRTALHLIGCILIPYGVSRLNDYLSVNYGFFMPWPVSIIWDLGLVIVGMWLLSLILNFWWYNKRCGAKGRKYHTLPAFSRLPPILAVIFSYALNFIPPLKIPLIFLEKIIMIAATILGEWVEDLVEGVKYVPGYFAGLIILVPIMGLATRC